MLQAQIAHHDRRGQQMPGNRGLFLGVDTCDAVSHGVVL